MNHLINIERTVTTEQCQAVLTTATDMGGINYWETPFRNRIRDDDLNCISFEVKCVDAPQLGGQLGAWVKVDEMTIVRGLVAIAQNPDLCAKSTRGSILELLSNKEDGIEMCDLEAADVIIQVGLFGELVYG